MAKINFDLTPWSPEGTVNHISKNMSTNRNRNRALKWSIFFVQRLALHGVEFRQQLSGDTRPSISALYGDKRRRAISLKTRNALTD